MDIDTPFRRSQVYRFLAGAFLYPAENWLEDLPLLEDVLGGLETRLPTPPGLCDLETLQADHRHTLGLSGSLPYETEIGMPNEFRQSQELADIAGFYHAFGFQVGGAVRERPDFLATELEFMCLVALMQAWAARDGSLERVEVCLQAQRSFLQDHLGRWIGFFAEGLARTAALSGDSNLQERPYLWLARFCADFVTADAEKIGVELKSVPLFSMAPTPIGPDLSCDTCPVNN